VYTLLKGMLKELSRAGYYTYRHDPAHAARYSVSYTSHKRKGKEAAAAVSAS
jgi:DNA-binding MarR family transcriptional regulator